MTPLIFEGIHSMYKDAMSFRNKSLQKSESEKEIAGVPSILKIFQYCLKETEKMNEHLIESETNRIRIGSKCVEWFDSLVKAVIKSYIVLLTYNISDKKCELVEQKYHEKVQINHFIHKCYIESARKFYNSPELFWHKLQPLQIKKNQRDCFEIIKLSIKEAIRKMLPMKIILREYLKNDYINSVKKYDNDAYTRIKTQVQHSKLYSPKSHEDSYEYGHRYQNKNEHSKDNIENLQDVSRANKVNINTLEESINYLKTQLNSGENEHLKDYIGNLQDVSCANKVNINTLEEGINHLKSQLNNDNSCNHIVNEKHIEFNNDIVDNINNSVNSENKKTNKQLEEISKIDDPSHPKPGIIPPAEDNSEIMKLIKDGLVLKTMPNIRRSKKKIWDEMMIRNELTELSKSYGINNKNDDDKNDKNDKNNDDNISVNNDELQRSEKSEFFARYINAK
jgi:hypothetical protein